MQSTKTAAAITFGIAIGCLAMAAIEVLVDPGPPKSPPSACVEATEEAIDAQAALERAALHVALECRSEQKTVGL